MKKSIRKFIIGFITAVILTVVGGMSAYAAEASDFVYGIYTIGMGPGSPSYQSLVINKYTGNDTVLYISPELFPEDKNDYESICIDENAFVNRDSLETVVFSEEVERIIYGGFSDCDSLKTAVFLSPDTIIDNLNGIFKDESFTIYGLKNSTAEQYAVNNYLPFVELKADALTLKSSSYNNGIKLTWNDFGANSYTVYVVSSNGATNKIYTGKELSFDYIPAKSGIYDYYVIADFDTFNIKSNVITQFTGKIATLNKPVVTKSVSGMSVKLSWKKISGATAYDIYYCKKGEKAFKLLDTTTKLNYTYTADEKGTFYFKVAAKAETKGTVTAKSAKSDQVTVSLKPKTLSTPVVTQKNFSGVSVKLSWKKVSGATEYEIYYAEKGSTKFKLLATTDKLNYTYTADKQNTYYFKVAAKGYSSKGVLTGQSAKSKQITVKLSGSSLKIEDTGYYRDVQKTDPEYKAGISRVFVNGSHKVGTDVPSGWYILYPTDKSQGYSAFNGKKPGVAASIAKPQYTIGSNTGDALMIYAEEGSYLTLCNCYAVKYNAREKLPTGKNSCIIWEGSNFNKGKYQLSYDGTSTGTYNGVTYFNTIMCKVFDADTGKLVSEKNFEETVTKKPSISLKDGQILLLEYGATLT